MRMAWLALQLACGVRACVRVREECDNSVLVLLLSISGSLPQRRRGGRQLPEQRGAHDHGGARPCRAVPALAQREGGDGKKLLRCAGCRAFAYCGPAHQRDDWPRHKAECGVLKRRLATDAAKADGASAA